MYRYGLFGRWRPLSEDCEVLEGSTNDWRGNDLENIHWNVQSFESTTQLKHSSPWSKKCECFPVEKWKCKIRRFECLKSSKKRTAVHVDWYAILCEPRGLEGLAIRLKKWYLVPWVRPLRNVQPEATLPCKRHERTLQASAERAIPSDWPTILPRAGQSTGRYAQSGPIAQTELSADIGARLCLIEVQRTRDPTWWWPSRDAWLRFCRIERNWIAK